MTHAISRRAANVTTDKSQGIKLRFVPILGHSHDRPAYELLRAETLDLVKVTEISEGGSVPELQVENRLDVRVFLMDGQELIGAKQNRILNTDVLVPAGSTVRIPVSCVEQGRWHHTSQIFSGGKSASHRTRSAKLGRVHESLKSGGKHDADQQAVWSEVSASLKQSGATSDTAALSDAYAKREIDLRQFRRSLQLPGEAVGAAVFHGSAFQGLDLFDRHSTLAYFWESLVDSYAIDLLEAPVDPGAPINDDGRTIQSILSQTVAQRWEPFGSPGEGKEWRTDGSGFAASALVWEDEVVMHLQVFPRPPGQDAGPAYRPRIRRRYRGG